MKHNFAKRITVLLVGLLTLALLTACEGLGQFLSTPTGDETTGNNPNETTEHDCVKDGHIEVIDAAVAPTCTETGLTEGKHCAACGTVLIPQEVVAAKGHNYGADGYCTYGCGTYTPSEGIRYTLNGTSYTVSGIGTCTDTDLVIPAEHQGLPVTSIAPYAFFNCSNLSSIIIPDSVTSIGYAAFKGCIRLTSVYITDLAKWCQIDFKDNPLSYAHNLYLNGTLVTELVIPDGVTSIGDDAFRNCSHLTSLTIPKSVTHIGAYAFANCNPCRIIFYNGSATEWNNIDRSVSWNSGCSGTIFYRTVDYENDPIYLVEDVLTDPLDLDNYQYRAYVRTSSGSGVIPGCIDFWTDDANSVDALTYAVYQRNKTIENTYNCSIKQINAKGDQYAEMLNFYTTGETFELAIVDNIAVATCACSNLLRDLNGLENIKLQHSTYDQNSIDEYTMGGKLYYLSGDMNISCMDTASVTIFNTKLFATYDFASVCGNKAYTDLYKLVADGKWTVDAMLEMATVVNVDSGEDGGALDATIGDIVGYYQYTASDGYYFYGCGGRLSKIEDIEDGGYPTLIIGEEKQEEVYNFLYRKLNTVENPWMPVGASGKRLSNYETGNTLFTDILVWDVRTQLHVRNKAAYGVLPIPKYNEDQDRYYNVVWASYGTTHLWSVPQMCSNADKASYLFHVIALYSGLRSGTMDAYYTKTLMLGKAEDSAARATMQIIRDSLTYDSCLMYDWGEFRAQLLETIDSVTSNAYGNVVTDDSLEVGRTQMNETLDKFKNPIVPQT